MQNKERTLSPVDELFKQLYGFVPNKAGAAYEMLSTLSYAIVKDVHVQHNQNIKSNFCDTDYQIDGLVNNEDGSKVMIEAKDYTIRKEKVGRGDLQKMQGALTDLTFECGKFTSATDYSKDAIEYAKGTHINPRQIPIDLLHIRPSTEDDRKGRVEEVHIQIHVKSLDFNSTSIKPIFGKDSKAFFKEKGLLGLPIKAAIDSVFHKDGSVLTTIEAYSKSLNDKSKLDYENTKFIAGKDFFDDAFILIGDYGLCPIDGFEYNVNIFEYETEFIIRQDGKPVLLIKSHDGSINKLITDEQLREYRFDGNGSAIHYK